MIPLVEQLKYRAIGMAVNPYRLRDWTLDVVRKKELGSYEWRVEIGAVDRPAYAYCVRGAARLARRLGLSRISVIEFGVAGGNGLVALERHARKWSEALGVTIDVYGFDTGRGLPPPTDYRDLPYHWKGGFYDMDAEALRSRLQSATLILGDIDDTLPRFVDEHDPAPVGAVLHDMDLYSSTAAALKLFDIEPTRRLPRIFTYFDDIIGNEISLFSDYTGERLAIREFNASHANQKISPAYNLSSRALSVWHRQVYVTHDFVHPQYNDFVSRPVGQLPLKDVRA